MDVSKIEVTKDQKVIVFKALSEIKSKMRGEKQITLNDIRKHPEVSKKLTDEELGVVLRTLDE